MAYNLPFLHSQHARAPEVKRSGWGRKEGRLTVVALVSICFWALIARIAMRQGRVVILTSPNEASLKAALRLLPGPEFWPTADGEGETSDEDADEEELPESGKFKIMSARNFHPDDLRALLRGLAEDQRLFTIASTHSEWLRGETRFYRNQPGALPVFWLHLD
ncbi:hypothetical protein [Paraburkholderia youngii]|uniref:hypothetical protein n=1 Tax=Paraburkholderia youngii TaxID=2782701 RepID=UPI003D1BDE65